MTNAETFPLPIEAAELDEAEFVATARLGTVGVLVPSELERQAAFAPFIDIAARRAGPDAVSLLSTYFVCGGLDRLTALVEGGASR